MKLTIRSHLSRRHSHQRGTAMVEAVAILPLFIILFVGIFYLRDSLIKSQELDAQARSCAWRYSKNACTVVPAGCEEFVREGDSKLADQSAKDRIDDALSEAQRSIANDGDGEQFIKKMIGKRIGPAISKLFGKAAFAEPSESIERPALFGGGTVRIQSHYGLACNLKNATAETIANEAWQLANKKKNK